MVDFRVFGAPPFSVQRSQNAYLKGFGGLWMENRGPKNAKINHDGSNPPFSVGPLKYLMNERQSRDLNRGAISAGSVRTKFCAFEGDMTATNASDSTTRIVNSLSNSVSVFTMVISTPHAEEHQNRTEINSKRVSNLYL